MLKFFTVDNIDYHLPIPTYRSLPHPDSSGNTCLTQFGQGDVMMSSCREISGQLIVYLLHNHIAVRGA